MRIERPAYITSRAATFLMSVLLIMAGVFAAHYAFGPSTFWSLIAYVICLGGASCLKRYFDWSATTIAGERSFPQRNSDRQSYVVMAEGIELCDPTRRTTSSASEAAKKPREMVQQSLDLDGMEALRSLSHVTGQWFVYGASQAAVELVRTACLALVEGGDADVERVERWFEIADGLRSRECQRLPKAELRRSYVAESVGVSKEQVRQIDQGRYLPLNKLLDEIDPKTL